MAEIIKRNKALSVSPLKASSTIGAALAFLGFQRAIPMLHGSQGCTAFGKVFFVRHFREPIPLQTTAMDQVSSVMGADDNVVEGLKAICEKTQPDLVGVPTTGLAETQGADIKRAVREFRARHPEYEHVGVVPVATPDYVGCLESGFALATHAILDALVPETPRLTASADAAPRRVTLLTGAHLTPGDLEVVKELVESFDLVPVVVPDLSDSLDGHLDDQDFNPLTMGGTPVNALGKLHDSLATLVIGASQYKSAELLRKRTGVPDYRFDHLMDLDAVDAFVHTLSTVSGNPVPPRLERQRAQLQDAMLDTHFMLGMAGVGVAADPDLLNGLSHLLHSVGADLVAAVAPDNAPVLARVAAESVKIGDLEELERLAREGGAELIVSNSHAVQTARRLGLPLVRAGFPQYDRLGGHARVWIGYQGIRQALYELANLMSETHKGEIAPYRSIYREQEHGISPDIVRSRTAEAGVGARAQHHATKSERTCSVTARPVRPQTQSGCAS